MSDKVALAIATAFLQALAVIWRDSERIDTSRKEGAEAIDSIALSDLDPAGFE